MFVSPISSFSPNFGMAMKTDPSLNKAMQDEIKATTPKKTDSRVKEHNELKVAIAQRSANTRDALVDITTSIVEEEGGGRYINGAVNFIRGEGKQVMITETDALTIRQNINPKKSLKKNVSAYLKKVDATLKRLQIEANRADITLVDSEIPTLRRRASNEEISSYLNIEA